MPFRLLGAAVALLIAGGGKFSLDGWLQRDQKFKEKYFIKETCAIMASLAAKIGIFPGRPGLVAQRLIRVCYLGGLIITQSQILLCLKLIPDANCSFKAVMRAAKPGELTYYDHI